MIFRGTGTLVIAITTMSSLLHLGCTKERNSANLNSDKSAQAHDSQSEIYQCPMHPQMRSDHPGECTICHMKLNKIRGPIVSVGSTTEKKVKFYRNPMDPSVHSDKPTKDSMGMDYIPVYENSTTGAEGGTVSLSPDQTKLSGTMDALIEKQDLIADIRVPGRVLGGTRVSFQAFEQDSAEIKTGMEFEAETPSAPGQVLIGKITFVDSILDPMTRTIRVDGVVTSGSKSNLRTEASVVGKLKIKHAGILSVPEEAVLHTGSRDLVYVSNSKGGFSPREVTLGIKANGRYEVKSGVTLGEKVSAGPNFLLDSESRIESTQ